MYLLRTSSGGTCEMLGLCAGMWDTATVAHGDQGTVIPLGFAEGCELLQITTSHRRVVCVAFQAGDCHCHY
jgi:hypothetical protein